MKGRPRRFVMQWCYDNWRITDTKTDSRIATCFDPSNAMFITNALNIAEAARAVHASRNDDAVNDDYSHMGAADANALIWLGDEIEREPELKALAEWLKQKAATKK